VLILLLPSLQVEAQEYLGSCSCPQYMEKAERRLHEEKERVDNYLDPSSEPKITRVVENELIKKQVPPLLHPYTVSAQTCFKCAGLILL